MSADFFSGFLAGFLVATLLGVIFGQIQRAIVLVEAPGKLQSVSTSTKMTPWQVIGRAIRGLFTIITWLLILGIGLWFLGSLIFSG